ncbi:hypothetical protein J6S88_05965 [bacterium]|nr:hypothetical protein [bacterium]
MIEKKSIDIEDLMLDYGEMTSFDFDSETYREVQAIHEMDTQSYLKEPVAFKYGHFDLVDMFHAFMSEKSFN